VRNIVVIGFMAAGKTAVGCAIAARLGWDFCDTDDLIVRRVGKPVRAIFADYGEPRFRELERDVVREAATRRNTVIACGGGAPLDEENATVLRAGGTIVWLQADLAATLKRLGEAKNRPLLKDDPAGRAASLMEARHPRYQALADIIVDTSAQPVEAVTRETLGRLAARERRSVPVALAEGGYEIHVGDGTLPLVGLDLVSRGIHRVALVTHPLLWRHYGSSLAVALARWGVEVHPISIPPGERSKSLRALAGIYDALVEARIDRGGAVLALGGGVVGDVAGFAAATYLRGIALFQLPTTLLAQVDASIGGKTAVNLAAKNLVGVFWQPLAVHADVRTLATLPGRELRCGLAEAIKHAAIADAALFDWTASSLGLVARRDTPTLAELVARNAAIKAEIVASDERESTGAREMLNFGHTIGHAVEAVAGYRGISHGEAVAVGMSLEAEIGVRLGLTPAEDAVRLRQTLAEAGLPTRMPGGSAALVLDRMALDKKVRAGKWRFSLMGQLGAARSGVVVDPTLAEGVIKDMTEPTS